MGKLVVLNLGGSFEQGFFITLQIGEETARSTSETTGKLPAAPEILQAYYQWQIIYRSLDLRGRPIGLAKPQNGATIADCQEAADQLGIRFNHWLQSE